ncbi:phosphopantetheine-binding protein [bacterium]|nr:phosphopantetheine-binding protein [bacterium]
MNESEIVSRVKKAAGFVLKIDPEQISDDANFVFDLGADSKQSVQLVGALEEEFGVSLDEDKALAVQDIDSCVKFVAQYL